MSQSNNNKVIEVVVDTTLNKSNLLEKTIENKHILYLSLGLLGCFVLYKNTYKILEGINSLYKDDEELLLFYFSYINI